MGGLWWWPGKANLDNRREEYLPALRSYVSVMFRYTNAQAAAALLSAAASGLRQKGFARGCQNVGKDVPTVGANDRFCLTMVR